MPSIDIPYRPQPIKILDDQHLKLSNGRNGYASDGKISVSKTNSTASYGLDQIAEGINVPLNTGVSINSRPEWLDENKLKLGRDFAIRHIFGLMYSDMLSLAMLFSFRGSLEALIYTGKSNTPYKAFQRYLATVTLVNSWYEGDVWEEGSEAQRNMSIVRGFHASVSKRMNGTPKEQLAPKVTLEGRGDSIWCPYTSDLRKDFEGHAKEIGGCPFSPSNSISLGAPHASPGIYFNQLDMSITQFGFFGLILLYPKQFGAHDASEEELEGFVHLWRALGYLLGIEDRYNFCSGSLEETKKRVKGVLDIWIKSGNLKHVTPEWEHMYRCVVEGISYYVPGNTFGGAMAYLCWVIGVPAPHLHAAMTWKEWFLFNLHRLVLCYVLRLPGLLSFHNWLIKRALERAKNASSSWHQSKKNKVYDYKKEKKSVTHL